MSAHKPIKGMSGTHGSVWLHRSAETHYQPIPGDISCDVAVIGGGMTGLTTAYLLKQAGFKTVVIEKNHIARGTTGHSTAKLTSAHGIIYQDLLLHFGREQARIYAEANQWAIDWLADLVKEKQLDCDFKWINAYTFAETDKERNSIESELQAAESLGLPVFFADTPGLPFPTKGAIGFKDQALFHPVKYALGIARLLVANSDGSAICERTLALDVQEGSPCVVITDKGRVKARHVVLATLYPFLKAGEFFTKLSPKQSYVMAANVKEQIPDGMYYAAGEYGMTIRPHTFEDGTKVIFGGDVHKVGQGGDIVARYRQLEEKLRNSYKVQSLEYYWTTHDTVSMDDVPYIGKVSPRVSGIYVATGFKQWGLTHGIIAARILCDLIENKENFWLRLYDSTRPKPKTSSKSFVMGNPEVAEEFMKDLVFPSSEDIGRIANDSAGIIERGEEKIGVYKSEKGELHSVSLTCTHMGCQPNWNNAERTWDCPCHGSRFKHTGEVEYGPANKDLAKKEL